MDILYQSEDRTFCPGTRPRAHILCTPTDEESIINPSSFRFLGKIPCQLSFMAFAKYSLSKGIMLSEPWPLRGPKLTREKERDFRPSHMVDALKKRGGCIWFDIYLRKWVSVLRENRESRRRLPSIPLTASRIRDPCSLPSLIWRASITSYVEFKGRTNEPLLPGPC